MVGALVCGHPAAFGMYLSYVQSNRESCLTRGKGDTHISRRSRHLACVRYIAHAFRHSELNIKRFRRSTPSTASFAPAASSSKYVVSLLSSAYSSSSRALRHQDMFRNEVW